MSAKERGLLAIRFFISLAEDIPEDVKKKNVVQCLEEGANVNQKFNNDCTNTPLHIAVNFGNIEIVKLLLQRGAKINYKNVEGKMPVDLANELDSDVGSAMVELLEAFEAEAQMNEDIKEFTENDLSIVQSVDPKLIYWKRAGTSGIKRQFYETKLLSSILIRAALQEFEMFYLGSRLAKMYAFNDICMRYRKGENEGVVFLQTIHRSDVKKNKITLEDMWKNEEDFSLYNYYHSYLTTLRYLRYASVNDPLFKTINQNFKHTFVIYTAVEIDLKDKMLVDIDSIDETVKDLICNNDCTNMYKYRYNEGDVELLTNIFLDRHMTCIAKILVDCMNTGNYINLLNIDCIRKYHVVLAQKVLHVSEIKEGGYRICNFRKEFLEASDRTSGFLKRTIFDTLISTTEKNKANISDLINNVCDDPTALSISKLMQVIDIEYYYDKHIIYTRDISFTDVTNKLFYIKLNHKIFCEAMQLATDETLGRVCIKLPPTFGNIDIVVEDQENRDRYLKCFAENFIKLITVATKPDLNRIERVAEHLGEITFEIFNRVLGSAVGNLLILDEKTNSFKFNMNEQSLGENARTVLNILKDRISNLSSLTINTWHKYFPKLTLDSCDDEKQLAINFFDDLLFYKSRSCQARNDEIEENATKAIKDYCIENKHESRKTSSLTYDAIYFKIHDVVQKWWMAEEKSFYLENNREFIDRLVNELSKKSLLNIVSDLFINTMKKYDITFNKDTVDCLKSQIGPEVTVLITEVNILTGIKLTQCFHNTNNYAFIDLNDNNETCFSRHDYYTLMNDLKGIKLKALIILYDETTVSKNNIFLRLTNKSVTDNFILVTNEKSAGKLKFYIERKNVVYVRDVRNDLNDLDFKSQKTVLDNMLLFQGEFVRFSAVITPKSKTLIRAKILQKIVKNETIAIGKTLSNPYYEGIKYCYIHRHLDRISSSKHETQKDFTTSPITHKEGIFKIHTLESLKDTVVIVGVPGIGKSTFLTNLSIETKRFNPKLWIERINLLDQTKELYRLRDNEIKINKIDAVKFVCKAALTKSQIRVNANKTSIPNFDLEIKNGEVVLKDTDKIDFLVQFELETLINCYNQGNTILLFDGFDEICPHYKKETTEILKCLVTRCSPDIESSFKQRMWITSRSYNNIRETLENEFGIAYNLKLFSMEEQVIFMKKYLKLNLNITELNFEQFQNIDSFFKFIEKFNAKSMYREKGAFNIFKESTFFLEILYFHATIYFITEINKPMASDKKALTKKWPSIFEIQQKYYNYTKDAAMLWITKHQNNVKDNEADSLTFTPLHLYIIMDYFVNQIKTVNSDQVEDVTKKWEIEINISSLYKYFIEMKLKKIRFEEKNQVDLNNPDNKMIVERELKDFMNKHKKLAFYAMFKDDLNKLLTEKDIKEIYNLIKEMIDGREKTGLVDSIRNDGIPKFIHLSLQEHLAVEYMTDLLKTNKNDQMKLWTFILKKSSDGFLEFFERKLESDDKLIKIITDIETKKNIFNSLTCNIYSEASNDNLTVLDRSINLRLKQTITLLLGAMAEVVNVTNLVDFLTVIIKFIFQSVAELSWDEVLKIILNCMRNIDATRLFAFNPCFRKTKPYEEMSLEEMVIDIKWHVKRFMEWNNQKRSRKPRSRYCSF